MSHRPLTPRPCRNQDGGGPRADRQRTRDATGRARHPGARARQDLNGRRGRREAGRLRRGGRRRLEIARALVSEPRVLFLDEPTVGLDPRIRHELLDVISSLRARTRMTILLTTHYLDEAERLCDRLAIMHAGRIVALNTPAALLARLGREIVELRVPGDPADALASLRSHGIVDGDGFAVGSTLTLPLHDRSAADAVAAIGDAGVGATSISTRRPTLDDVYLRLTGGRLAESA